jgi:hypothetical protein
VGEVRDRELPPDSCSLLSCAWAGEGSCSSAMLILEIGKLGGGGRCGADFRKVLFAELKGKWDAGKIGRSSLEMIETTLFDVEGSFFERVLCLLKLGDATDREF